MWRSAAMAVVMGPTTLTVCRSEFIRTSDSPPESMNHPGAAHLLHAAAARVKVIRQPATQGVIGLVVHRWCGQPQAQGVVEETFNPVLTRVWLRSDVEYQGPGLPAIPGQGCASIQRITRVPQRRDRQHEQQIQADDDHHG